MQTFITFRKFSRIANALDNARLGKQRAETLQILRALRHEAPMVGNPWAYKMWEGHEECLVYYGLVITHEWRIVRGFQDSTWGDFGQLAADYGMLRTADMVKEDMPVEVVRPRWLSEDWILRSHRSRLIEKMPAVYGPKFGSTPENMPYLWPVWDDNARHGYKLIVSRADVDRLDSGERVLPLEIELLDKLTGEVRITK